MGGEQVEFVLHALAAPTRPVTGPDEGRVIHLIDRIERAIDEHPHLTRERFGTADFRDEAEIVVSRRGCTAQIKVRHLLAKGRGARLMQEIWSSGETPEEATQKLIDSLPHWDGALR
jgi:hypothetical protein